MKNVRFLRPNSKVFLCLTVIFLMTVSQVSHAKCPNKRDCPKGSLCFDDIDTSEKTCGKVQGTNKNWGDFGWNDRADHFYNNGRTHNSCVYKHVNFGSGFLSRGKKLILIGDHLGDFSGKVSSNKWIQNHSC